MTYQKTCKICKKEFESESRNTLYCCDKCAKRGAKRAYRSRKMKRIRSTDYVTEKEIDKIIKKAYALSREIGEMFLNKKCMCIEPGHVCEGEIELHHIDHCPMNMHPSNLIWLCKKAHVHLHSLEEDCDFPGELKSFLIIKEQSNIRKRNNDKRDLNDLQNQ